MQDKDEGLDPQPDENASPDAERFKDDTSINTAPDAEPEPEEVETEPGDDTEEPESEGDPSTPAEEDGDEKTDPQPGDIEYTQAVKERIDAINASFREEQRLNRELTARIAELEQQIADAPQPVEPFKTLADFDYNEAEWQSYMAEEVTRRATSAAEEVTRGFQARQESSSAEESFREREREFAKGHEDYHDLVYGEVDGQRRWACSDLMAREIMVSSMGERVSYYLATHPDIALQISRASPAETIRRMARLETTIESAETAKKAAKKVLPKAPPPVPKIPSGKDAMEKDPADMSDKEFAAWRRKQIAAR